jgi:hypothetical protein
MHWTNLANATKFCAAYKYSCAEQAKEVAYNEIVNRMTSIEVYITMLFSCQKMPSRRKM